eukprot:3486769-Amphidinium_carterae.1
MDLVREANRMKKEADLRKEQEAKNKNTKEMRENEDELRSTIRQDVSIREEAHREAKLFLTNNQDNSILHKHCETKITRAIGDKSALLYAKYTYILGIATGLDLEKLFDARDQEMPQGAAEGGLTGLTAPSVLQGNDVLTTVSSLTKPNTFCFLFLVPNSKLLNCNVFHIS